MKKLTLENCTFPLCGNPAVREGFCTHHARVYAPASKAKPAARIPYRSEKRERLQKEYRELVKQMLSENKNCQIKAPCCTKKAEGLHHIVKRTEKNLCDKANLIRACNHCNLYIETHDSWAREKGFVKSKFSK